MVLDLHLDKVIMGIGGIHPDIGLTNLYPQEMMMDRTYRKSATISLSWQTIPRLAVWLPPALPILRLCARWSHPALLPPIWWIASAKKGWK